MGRRRGGATTDQKAMNRQQTKGKGSLLNSMKDARKELDRMAMGLDGSNGSPPRQRRPFSGGRLAPMAEVAEEDEISAATRARKKKSKTKRANERQRQRASSPEVHELRAAMAEDLDDFIYMDKGELMELANEQNQQDTAAKRRFNATTRRTSSIDSLIASRPKSTRTLMAEKREDMMKKRRRRSMGGTGREASIRSLRRGGQNRPTTTSSSRSSGKSIESRIGWTLKGWSTPGLREIFTAWRAVMVHGRGRGSAWDLPSSVLKETLANALGGGSDSTWDKEHRAAALLQKRFRLLHVRQNSLIVKLGKAFLTTPLRTYLLYQRGTTGNHEALTTDTIAKIVQVLHDEQIDLVKARLLVERQEYFAKKAKDGAAADASKDERYGTKAIGKTGLTALDMELTKCAYGPTKMQLARMGMLQVMRLGLEAAIDLEQIPTLTSVAAGIRMRLLGVHAKHHENKHDRLGDASDEAGAKLFKANALKHTMHGNWAHEWQAHHELQRKEFSFFVGSRDRWSFCLSTNQPAMTREAQVVASGVKYKKNQRLRDEERLNGRKAGPFALEREIPSDADPLEFIIGALAAHAGRHRKLGQAQFTLLHLALQGAVLQLTGHKCGPQQHELAGQVSKRHPALGIAAMLELRGAVRRARSDFLDSDLGEVEQMINIRPNTKRATMLFSLRERRRNSLRTHAELDAHSAMDHLDAWHHHKVAEGNIGRRHKDQDGHHADEALAWNPEQGDGPIDLYRWNSFHELGVGIARPEGLPVANDGGASQVVWERDTHDNRQDERHAATKRVMQQAEFTRKLALSRAREMMREQNKSLSAQEYQHRRAEADAKDVSMMLMKHEKEREARAVQRQFEREHQTIRASEDSEGDAAAAAAAAAGGAEDFWGQDLVQFASRNNRPPSTRFGERFAQRSQRFEVPWKRSTPRRAVTVNVRGLVRGHMAVHRVWRKRMGRWAIVIQDWWRKKSFLVKNNAALKIQRWFCRVHIYGHHRNAISERGISLKRVRKCLSHLVDRWLAKRHAHRRMHQRRNHAAEAMERTTLFQQLVRSMLVPVVVVWTVRVGHSVQCEEYEASYATMIATNERRVGMMNKRRTSINNALRRESVSAFRKTERLAASAAAAADGTDSKKAGAAASTTTTKKNPTVEPPKRKKKTKTKKKKKKKVVKRKKKASGKQGREAEWMRVGEHAEAVLNEIFDLHHTSAPMVLHGHCFIVRGDTRLQITSNEYRMRMQHVDLETTESMLVEPNRHTWTVRRQELVRGSIEHKQFNTNHFTVTRSDVNESAAGLRAAKRKARRTRTEQEQEQEKITQTQEKMASHRNPLKSSAPLATAIHEFDTLSLILQIRILERDVNARVDAQGRTPLHVAVRCMNYEAAKALIDAGADTNAADDTGNTPLHEAFSRGLEPIVKMLLRRGGRKSLRKRNCFAQKPTDLRNRGEEARKRRRLFYGTGHSDVPGKIVRIQQGRLDAWKEDARKKKNKAEKARRESTQITPEEAEEAKLDAELKQLKLLNQNRDHDDPLLLTKINHHQAGNWTNKYWDEHH